MEGKECTCKVVFTKALMIAGIITGALVSILGIVTIAGDTGGLFAAPIVQFWLRDTTRITFSDTKGLNYPDIWKRSYERVLFEWTTQEPKFVQECDAKYLPLKTGFRTKKTSTGSELVYVENFTIDIHYYCVSHPDGVHCEGSSAYQGRIHMYNANYFYGTHAYLGNQNHRWTIFVFAMILIAFGVVMILGELHVPLVVTKFTFFYYSFVKGLIYIALGFPCMGLANFFGLVTAIVLWIVGILNCIIGWRSVTHFDWKKVGQRGTTAVVTRREYI